METAVRQRYDIPSDEEVFDMLNAVSREKEVGWLYICWCCMHGSMLCLAFQVERPDVVCISCPWC
jgi:hypothetical protein